MNLAPFFSFYGAKWRAAKHYPAPQHRTLVEPFAGSAGYAGRYYEHDVVLVERDPVIASLWRYLIAATSTEILALPLIEPDQTTADLDACPDAKSLIGFWLNKGTGTPHRMPGKWMRSGLYPRQFWGETIRRRVADQVEQIRHWTVIEGDYSDAPDVLATWFIDAPYLRAGRRHYKHGSRDINFERLSTWCKERRGQTIVCENTGETWLPFQPHIEINSTKGKNRSGFSSEAIWTNNCMTPQRQAELLFAVCD